MEKQLSLKRRNLVLPIGFIDRLSNHEITAVLTLTTPTMIGMYGLLFLYLPHHPDVL